jgi:16S rRNA (cytidine1402-2'-O)-methyltransferase
MRRLIGSYGRWKIFIEILGDREAAVIRELTKLHQSVHHGLTSVLLDQFTKAPPKGECCLLLAPFCSGDRTRPALRMVGRIEEIGTGRHGEQEAMKIVAMKRVLVRGISIEQDCTPAKIISTI